MRHWDSCCCCYLKGKRWRKWKRWGKGEKVEKRKKGGKGEKVEKGEKVGKRRKGWKRKKGWKSGSVRNATYIRLPSLDQECQKIWANFFKKSQSGLNYGTEWISPPKSKKVFLMPCIKSHRFKLSLIWCQASEIKTHKTFFWHFLLTETF